MVDGPPHPNPHRAADGLKLRILSIDVAAAPVVQRIFREYIGGRGDKAIAEGLNRDGIPCPSAHRPEQNRHRSGDGWQAPTVAAISQNPRYTGYAVFGRWTKREELIDPDDVAAGYAIRFVRGWAPCFGDARTKPAHRFASRLMHLTGFETEARLDGRHRRAHSPVGQFFPMRLLPMIAPQRRTAKWPSMSRQPPPVSTRKPRCMVHHHPLLLPR
ncbi:recombinase family protein [Nocardia suismassiliense]|uniref:Recombinase family protein n=1 Tax=Nocardia suismassiliense TaxID=2077092 RepID=A0ABW6R0X7_9NOCA